MQSTSYFIKDDNYVLTNYIPNKPGAGEIQFKGEYTISYRYSPVEITEFLNIHTVV